MSQILYSGQTTDVNLQTDEYIAVACLSGTYSLSIIEGASAGTSIASATSVNAMYGPYTKVKLRLTCQDGGSVDFEVGANPTPDYKPAEVRGVPVTATRDLNAGDVEQVLDCNSGSAIVLTIKNDTTMGAATTAVRQTIAAYQAGAGAVSFAAGAGVTLRGTLPTIAQYGTMGVMRVGANEWAYL
jgi:hypothetical protein